MKQEGRCRPWAASTLGHEVMMAFYATDIAFTGVHLTLQFVRCFSPKRGRVVKVWWGETFGVQQGELGRSSCGPRLHRAGLLDRSGGRRVLESASTRSRADSGGLYRNLRGSSSTAAAERGFW